MRARHASGTALGCVNEMTKSREHLVANGCRREHGLNQVVWTEEVHLASLGRGLPFLTGGLCRKLCLVDLDGSTAELKQGKRRLGMEP